LKRTEVSDVEYIVGTKSNSPLHIWPSVSCKELLCIVNGKSTKQEVLHTLHVT